MAWKHWVHRLEGHVEAPGAHGSNGCPWKQGDTTDNSRDPTRNQVWTLVKEQACWALLGAYWAPCRAHWAYCVEPIGPLVWSLLGHWEPLVWSLLGPLPGLAS